MRKTPNFMSGIGALRLALRPSASTRRVSAGSMTPSSHNEAGDVLQEHARHLALAAQLDEVRALVGALREQDAVVGDDAHRHALDPREAAHQRRAVARLELLEFRAVDDAGDDLAHVEG